MVFLKIVLPYGTGKGPRILYYISPAYFFLETHRQWGLLIKGGGVEEFLINVVSPAPRSPSVQHRPYQFPPGGNYPSSFTHLHDSFPGVHTVSEWFHSHFQLNLMLSSVQFHSSYSLIIDSGLWEQQANNVSVGRQVHINSHASPQ